MTTDVDLHQHHDDPHVLAAVADSARLAQLERSGLLQPEPDPTFDRFARIAAALVGAPVSFVSLVGIDGMVTPGVARMDEPSDAVSLPAEDSFCQYAISTGEPLVIEDTRQDVLVRDTPIARDGELQSYAGIPLRTAEGNVLGTLCVLDRKPRTWQERELSLLHDLTVVVQQEIQHRLQAGRLTGASGLARDMALAVERLTDAARALIEAADAQEDARLQRLSAVAASRLDGVRKLARDLRVSAVDEDAPAATNPVTDLRQAVSRSVTSVRAATRTSALELATLPPLPMPVRSDALPLEAAITHALVSTLHRTSPEGTVEIGLSTATPEGAGGAAELTVRARDCQLPATELARIVSRLQEATTGTSRAGAPPAPAAVVRMAGGALTAHSGPVRGASSPAGTTITVDWPLDRDGIPAPRMP